MEVGGNGLGSLSASILGTAMFVIWNLLLSTSSRPALGHTQLPVQSVLGPPSPGLKRPELEADHSSPTSAEVKKMWIYTSTPS
jgi:hypothetical protein